MCTVLGRSHAVTLGERAQVEDPAAVAAAASVAVAAVAVAVAIIGAIHVLPGAAAAKAKV